MYAITAIHTGENGAIFLPYTLIFLTLQRWQTFFNCANFLQIFFDFFVKMPFGVFRGRRVLCVSRCSLVVRYRRRRAFSLTSLSLRYTDGGDVSLASLLLRFSEFGGNPRPNVARLITGGKAYFTAFFGRSFVRCGIVPRSGVCPLKRRIFGVFRGYFPVLLQIPVQKNTGGNGGNHTGGNVGGILARVGGNREGLIFVVQVSKHTNAQLKGVLCVFKIFYIILYILYLRNRL